MKTISPNLVALALAVLIVVASLSGALRYGEPVGAQLSVSSNVVQPDTGGSDAMTSSTDMSHSHPLLEVSQSDPIPTVTHLVFPDAMDGYNIQILAENFEITPASINRDVVANTGHAHLYVNGVKTARIYGQWYHLPSSALQPGVNLVSITLNANNHSQWAHEGMPIASTVRVILPSATETAMVQAD